MTHSNILRLTPLLLAACVASAVAEPADAPAAPGQPGPVSAAGTEAPFELLGAVLTGNPSDIDRSSEGAAAPQPQRAPDKKVSRTTPLADMPAGLGFDAGANSPNAERVVFQRAPIRIVLPLARERLITFPGPIALHVPDGFESLVQSQIIERTAYLKPLAPFGSLRVVAEDLTTGRQIPIDLVVDAKTKTALGPVDVMVAGSVASSGASAGATGDETANANTARAGARSEPPALDMVGLTRFAAQSLYAPKRLLPAIPGVKQLPVASTPVEGLYRGWRVQTTPIGAWRSGQLYVTALLFTNQGPQPIDIDLQEMRGRWLAASAQHTRLLASGSDWSTTTVYLVCDRPFEACR